MSATSLSPQEAAKRLVTYGRNELPRKRQPSPVVIFIRQFFSPLLIILSIAGIITLLVGERLDTIVIFGAVLLNAMLGFVQEFRAIRTLHALSQVLGAEAIVVRNGERIKIDASTIVPGDIVVLEHGQKVPADGVILKAEDLQLNEAILTGESEPVQKYSMSGEQPPHMSFEQYSPKSQTKHSVYMGSSVFSGFGKMLVIQTGKHTAIGRLATDLGTIKQRKTPLQKKLDSFAFWLTVLVGLVIVAVMVIGLIKGYEFRLLGLLAVALAVSAIPEGLALVLTSILSLGMMRIFKKHGLVRSLVAAETLGSVDVICTDKTGTLTYGELQLVDVIAKESVKQELYRALAVTADLRDPLETEMKRWIERKKLSFSGLRTRYPRMSHLAFTLENRFTASQTARHLYVFGAPEVVLERSKLTSATKKLIQDQLNDFAGRGYRLIAVGGRERRGTATLAVDDVRGLSWLGFLVYRDQERQDIRSALKRAQQAGAAIKVITGDFPQTVKGLLERLDWFVTDEQLCTGSELESITSQKDLRQKVEQTVVFARVTPQQKLKIVKTLQENGHVVAMMGDGVNDALALRKADISIVVRSASDVAKEIADLVLLNNNFGIVVAAIEEGRIIRSQLQKVIVYLMSNSFTEVILVLATIMFGLPVPLTAAQILWINIVTDGPPSFALMFEQKDRHALARGPKSKDEPILSLSSSIFAGLVSLMTGSIAFGTFLYLLGTGSEMHAQTGVFLLVVLFSMFYVFSVRTLDLPLWKNSLFSNKPLLWTVVGTIGLQIALFAVPGLMKLLNLASLDTQTLSIVFAMVVVAMVSIEIIKLGIKTLRAQPLPSS